MVRLGKSAYPHCNRSKIKMFCSKSQQIMLKRMECRKFQCFVAQIKQSHHFGFHVRWVDNAIFRTLRVTKTYLSNETHYPTALCFLLCFNTLKGISIEIKRSNGVEHFFIAENCFVKTAHKKRFVLGGKRVCDRNSKRELIEKKTNLC